MMESVDFVDVSLVVITILCIAGLLFCSPIPETAVFLKATAAGGVGALGFKKAPSTLRM